MGIDVTLSPDARNRQVFTTDACWMGTNECCV